jgi:hypothetical protein
MCRQEYPIRAGIVEFGGDGWATLGGGDAASGAPLPDFRIVQAALGLASPGGYVTLLGSATRLTGGLAAAIPGVHFVGINPPPDVAPSPSLSLLRSGRLIPLRDAVVRGVVVGAEHATPSWLEESVRVTLRGQRVVALSETAATPGLTPLASGQGLWVGERRTQNAERRTQNKEGRG